MPLPLLVRRVDEDEVVAAPAAALVAERSGDVAVRRRRLRSAAASRGSPGSRAPRRDRARRRRSSPRRARAPRAPSRPSRRRGRARQRSSTGPMSENDGLAHAIAGRTRRGALRRRDPVALPRTRDDPHDSPRCSASPSRRSTSSARRPSSGKRSGGFARPLEEILVAAEPDEAEIRVARLTRAEELALAADLEIALGELEAVRRRDHRLEPLRRRSRRARRGRATRAGSTTARRRVRRARGADGAARGRSDRPPGRS